MNTVRHINKVYKLAVRPIQVPFPTMYNYRRFSDLPNKSTQQPARTFPRLMEFPEIIWPSFFKSIKNWILVHLIVRRYFDSEFKIKDFIFGARKAIQIVSAQLAKAEYTKLNQMITGDALQEIQAVTQKLPLAQRQALAVQEEDIFLMFPYEVGIMFDEEVPEKQKRWLEITVVCHVFRGLSELQKSGQQISWGFGNLTEYKDDIYVCNYRFIKDFTKGVQSNWMINIVNHFKPADLISEK